MKADPSSGLLAPGISKGSTMKFRSIAALPLLAMLAPAVASAETSEEAAAKFGAREFVRSISISPAGDHAVLVTPRQGGEAALVINFADGSTKPILNAQGGNERITNCHYVLDARIVCQIVFSTGSGRNIEMANRMVSLAPDGSDMRQLTAKVSASGMYESRYGGGVIDFNVVDRPNAILMLRDVEAQQATGTISGRRADGLTVEMVDLLDNSRRQIESPRSSAVEYISDGHGNVRLVQLRPTDNDGYAKSVANYLYRAKDGKGGWKPLSSVETKNALSYGFVPVAVDSNADVAYGFDSNNGFTGLYQMKLDGSGETSLVLGRANSDVDSLMTIGRDQRVVGASYATEKRYVEYFDPALKKLSTDIAKALGGGVSVDIVDASANESKLLLFSGSDTKPGQFYVYDKGTRQLAPLLPARPELAGMSLGEMKPITFPASDGTQIPGYLTLPPGSDGKNIPAIVMPHGGPWARDEWGFDWLVQYFANRGFAVLQPNFRGSTGYGSQWFQRNGFQSWNIAIGDINDAGRWLQKEGIAAPGKLGIFGWSYGGYAALQSQVVEPDLFKAVVAVAPVTDLDSLRAESLGYSNYRIMDQAIGNGPHIASGSPARHAAKFKAPVLLVHGDTDTNVAVQQSRTMADRLKDAGKQVDYIEFDGLAHQLDDAGARARMLVAAEKTLRQGMGL
ncbi:alpha/beta hydrolase family protein [Tsuneonella sp. HG222]